MIHALLPLNDLQAFGCCREEHKDASFILLGGGECLKAKGAEMVLKSLTSNARSVFGVLANRQLKVRLMR